MMAERNILSETMIQIESVNKVKEEPVDMDEGNCWNAFEELEPPFAVFIEPKQETGSREEEVDPLASCDAGAPITAGKQNNQEDTLYPENPIRRQQSSTTSESELILESDSDCASVWSSEDDPGLVDSESGEEVEEETGHVFASASPSQAVWTECPGQSANTSLEFTGVSGRKIGATSRLSSSSTPLDVFLLYFSSVLQVIVTETNRYYQQYLNKLYPRPNAEPDVSESEMWVFLAIILQMGHDMRDKLTDYWSKMDQFHTPFFGNCIKRDRFFHILHFLHFADLATEIDKSDENYDRLWKIREIFEMLRQAYEKYYYPTENLTINEVVVLFRGRVIFKKYIPKENRRFGIKIYKLCDRNGYTFDMAVHSLGNDRHDVKEGVTATHATVAGLTSKIKGKGHKLYMNSFFSSPSLFEDLFRDKISCCGTVHPNRKGLPKIIGENLKMKRGDVISVTKGNLTTLVWKDRREVYILTNMHPPPSNGNFCDASGKAIKPAIIADYSANMENVGKADRMTNSYTVGRRTWKWAKRLFFHLLNLTVLNAFVLFSSCGAGSLSQRDFRLLLIRNIILCKGQAAQPVGRPSSSSASATRLESRSNSHWPVPSGSFLRCRVCAARGIEARSKVKCARCDVGLCVKKNCFVVYHNKTFF